MPFERRTSPFAAGEFSAGEQALCRALMTTSDALVVAEAEEEMTVEGERLVMHAQFTGIEFLRSIHGGSFPMPPDFVCL